MSKTLRFEAGISKAEAKRVRLMKDARRLERREAKREDEAYWDYAESPDLVDKFLNEQGLA